MSHAAANSKAGKCGGRLCLALLIGLLSHSAFGQPSRFEPAPEAGRNESVGTAFFVAEDRVVTAAHGVNQCSKLLVIPSHSAPLAASVIAADKQIDVALLSVPVHAGAVLLHNSAAPEIGQQVSALGYPLQFALRARAPSFYRSAVVGLGGPKGDDGSFRLDFVALPGMSGAAVLNSSAEVVGMIKSYIIETAPRGGPTIGGQTFVVSARVLDGFLMANGVQPNQSKAAEPVSARAVADRASEASLPILCVR